MSKPDDVSQSAWDAAERAFYYSEPGPGGAVEAIARAIMAAEKRGEEREREAILQFEFDLPIYRTGADCVIAVREYIRKRGEG